MGCKLLSLLSHLNYLRSYPRSHLLFSDALHLPPPLGAWSKSLGRIPNLPLIRYANSFRNSCGPDFNSPRGRTANTVHSCLPSTRSYPGVGAQYIKTHIQRSLEVVYQPISTNTHNLRLPKHGST